MARWMTGSAFPQPCHCVMSPESAVNGLTVTGSGFLQLVAVGSSRKLAKPPRDLAGSGRATSFDHIGHQSGIALGDGEARGQVVTTVHGGGYRRDMSVAVCCAYTPSCLCERDERWGHVRERDAGEVACGR